LYGSLVFSVVVFFINTYYTGKFLNYSWFQQSKDILPYIFFAFLTSFILYSWDLFLEKKLVSDWIRLIMGLFGGSIVYFIICYVFKMSELKELILALSKIKF
jgi:teichuronic acid exporter